MCLLSLRKGTRRPIGRTQIDKATRQSVAKDLSMLGANANQIAKYCNQHQHEAPNYEALERNISELRERLDEIWKTLKEQ